MTTETEAAALKLGTRLATQADAQVILAFDEVARTQRQRVNFIYRTIASRNCHVVTADARTVGYGVLEYNFFEHGFISMLYIHSDFRRRGAGTALLDHLERACKTTRLFTSTSQSNTAMQALLARRKFRPSGIIENLAEGDAELVYYKPLRD